MFDEPPYPGFVRSTPDIEWRFDLSFKLTIAQDAETMLVRFSGDLDALTAKRLQRDDPIPTATVEHIVLDLSQLTNIDVTGVREVRRIEANITAAGGAPEIRGAVAHVESMLELLPATGSA